MTGSIFSCLLICSLLPLVLYSQHLERHSRRNKFKELIACLDFSNILLIVEFMREYLLFFLQVRGKRYSYHFILSSKTKKYISQLIDVDGTTVQRKESITPLKTNGEMVDDDSISVSSGSSGSDASSEYFIPCK